LSPFHLATLILLTVTCLAVHAGDFVPSLGDDIHEMVSPPSLTVLGSGAILTASSIFLENPSGNAGFLGSGFLHDASVFCHHTMGLPLLGGAIATWAGGSLFDSRSAEETGQMLTEGLLLTYGAAGILKLGTGRVRPDGSNSRSFPSAHAAGTACTAVILWDRYGAGAGIPMASVAAFTALSRVHLGSHFPSDVLAGTAIGVSVGLAVADAHSKEGSSQSVQPAFGIQWSSQLGFGVYSPHEE
jgi:hypothetical protein